jgi:hypothetical protein
MSYRTLDPASIANTIERLCQRVEHRFPGSGLSRVCRELDKVAEQARERAEWIKRPILALRFAIGLLIALILTAIGAGVLSLRVSLGPLRAPELLQVLESGINDVVFIGITIVFLLNLETRIKRRRALAALHELRSVAHVLDMHQLTKDPEWLLKRGQETGILPPRTMSRFELSRYLDYCGEALALTAKIAALYAQDFDDTVALQAVNEIETLTSDLARKIWQKLMILLGPQPEVQPAQAPSWAPAE